MEKGTLKENIYFIDPKSLKFSEQVQLSRPFIFSTLTLDPNLVTTVPSEQDYKSLYV